MIKHCKLMGLSLEEIKELIGTNITPESMYEILNRQQEIIANKIEELQRAKRYIDFLKKRVGITLERTLGEVIVEDYEAQKVMTYNYVSEGIDELEINMRKIIIDIEKNYGILNSEVIFKTSYRDILKEKFVYKNVMISNEVIRELETEVIPKGRYLSIYYDDYYTDSFKYYKKILEFAKDNMIEVEGDFYEFYIVPKTDREGKEKSLIQLSIKIKE
mgnify:CR=1 FL=1